MNHPVQPYGVSIRDLDGTIFLGKALLPTHIPNMLSELLPANLTKALEDPRDYPYPRLGQRRHLLPDFP